MRGSNQFTVVVQSKPECESGDWQDCIWIWAALILRVNYYCQSPKSGEDFVVCCVAMHIVILQLFQGTTENSITVWNCSRGREWYLLSAEFMRDVLEGLKLWVGEDFSFMPGLDVLCFPGILVFRINFLGVLMTVNSLNWSVSDISSWWSKSSSN